LLVTCVSFLRVFTGAHDLMQAETNLNVSMEKTRQLVFWMPFVPEDNAATSATAEAQMVPTTTVAIAATSTALVFNKTKSASESTCESFACCG
jgi:hypothetical protein